MRASLFGLFIVLCGASLLVGAQQMAWSQVFSLSGDVWLTLTASRLPRLMALVLTGVGLSVCGVILQHIVRNKFVEPATSGGLDAAKLGILVALTLTPTTGTVGRMLFALAFCFAASLIFVAIVRRIRFKNTILVPVIGLMYGGVLSAVAEFYAYRHNILQSMQGWLLGDFSRIVQGNYEIIYLILPIVALTYLYAHRFTVLGMGEGMATSLGLNYSATVALGGASLLLACDILGRLLIHPFEVPIGLTAGGVGGVLFLVLIFWRNR